MALPVPSQRPPLDTRRRLSLYDDDVRTAERGVRAAAEGKLSAVTEPDLEHWAETGEWPASSS